MSEAVKIITEDVTHHVDRGRRGKGDRKIIKPIVNYLYGFSNVLEYTGLRTVGV
jgi:hypothetical protein